jgi:hypothetical protein
MSAASSAERPVPEPRVVGATKKSATTSATVGGGVDSTSPSSPPGTTSALEVVLPAVEDEEACEDVADGLGVVRGEMAVVDD